jgi:nitrite reductase/ring-hydroxylating ferredoxin subunit
MSTVRWYKIASSANEIDWQVNNMCVLEVDGKKITIAKVADAVFACAYKCPHASGILADGFLDAAGNVVCPLHRYKFNLQTGRNVTGEGYFLPHYDVEIREDGIYVGFKEKGLFGF